MLLKKKEREKILIKMLFNFSIILLQNSNKKCFFFFFFAIFSIIFFLLLFDLKLISFSFSIKTFIRKVNDHNDNEDDVGCWFDVIKLRSHSILHSNRNF